MKKFKLLFLLIAGFVMAVSCSKSGEGSETTGGDQFDGKVELKTSLNKIKADGKETAKFTVLADGKDVTAEANIYQGTSALSVKEFKTTDAGNFEFYAEYKGKQSAKITIEAVKEAVAGSVVLKVSKSEIIANGNDKCSFTVFVDDKDVTANAVVYNSKDNSVLENKEFATKEAGDYEFYAIHNEKKSDVIKVKAVQVQDDVFTGTLELIVDKPLIAADGKEKAKFTVKADGKLVTVSANIYKKSDNTLITTKEFGTKEVGSYEFYAEYKGKTSNTVTVEAEKRAVLVLTADKSEFFADGVDKVVFNVTADGADVTGKAQIFQVKSGSEELLTSNEFTTTSGGAIRFRAKYERSESEIITVTAKVKEKIKDFTLNDNNDKPVVLSDIYKNKKYVYIDFWASWCGPCKTANITLKDLYGQYSGKGFEIVGVSLDSYKSQWLDAISSQGLPWKHVLDTKGYGNNYGVSAIPFAILIDKDGYIIKKGMEPRELRTFLAENLK